MRDFSIETEKQHGIKNLINLQGIESPGLTSSLAIGNMLKSNLERLTINLILQLFFQRLSLPLLPACPPIMFIFNKTGFSELYVLSFGTYLAGSKY